jgi:hypothetical protein
MSEIEYYYNPAVELRAMCLKFSELPAEDRKKLANVDAWKLQSFTNDLNAAFEGEEKRDYDIAKEDIALLVANRKWLREHSVALSTTPQNRKFHLLANAARLSGCEDLDDALLDALLEATEN